MSYARNAMWVAIVAVMFMAANQAHAVIVNAIGNPNGNGLINGSAVPIDLIPGPTDISLSKDYTSTGNMFLNIDVSGPTIYTIQEDIVNNTGIDWTDFHWELNFEGGPVFFTGINFGGPNPFANVMVMDNAIWLDGGVLPSGGVLVVDLLLEATNSAVTQITQFPTFVPEPFSAVLGMMGLTALGYTIKRRRMA